MFKRALFLGITAGLLSGLASVIFMNVYKVAMFTDFSPLVTPMQLMSACMFGCVLASVGFWLLMRVMPKGGEMVFNLLFTLLTFASIIGPIAHQWPVEADTDLVAYFPGFAITLHFFPAVIWFTLKPFFIKH